jgi:hypothetical protein
LDAITPKADAETTVSIDRLDDAAAKHGFVSREPETLFTRKKVVGPVVTLHTRAPVRVATPSSDLARQTATRIGKALRS